MNQNDNDIIREEAFHDWMQKDSLIRTATISFNGPPELKKEEKLRFLGEFRERIIKALTKEQIIEKEIYPEIVKAMESKKADKLIINGELNPLHYNKYEKIAKKFNIKTTINHDPEFVGDVGLVVVSTDPVNEKNIFIDRKLPNENDLNTNHKTSTYKAQNKHLSPNPSFVYKIKNIIHTMINAENKN